MKNGIANVAIFTTVMALACHSASQNVRQSTAADVMLRVQNSTGADCQGVTINGISFGDIPAGGLSGYEIMRGMYRYGSVSLTANGIPYKITPIDYVGETPLAAGYYECTLSIQDRRLSMHVLPDSGLPK